MTPTICAFHLGFSLGGLINDPQVGNVAIRLMANMPADYKAPFDFKNEGEYQRYIRDVELRALSGPLVKSFEELEIANWFTQNGVPFRYERTYPEDTTTKEYRQYQPDFWIPGQNIYIEHFAINENGAAPPGWTGYEEGVQWKRQKHQQYGKRCSRPIAGSTGRTSSCRPSGKSCKKKEWNSSQSQERSW